MKKKSHALRKRVLALVAALFLICLTAVPAFADDVQYITLNGLYYFDTTATYAVPDYFDWDTDYVGSSGYIKLWWTSTGTASSNDYVGFVVSFSTITNKFQFGPVTASNSMGYLLTSSEATTNTQEGYESSSFVYSEVSSGPYLEFVDFVIPYNGAIYNFLNEYAGAGTTVSFHLPVSAGSIVNVITGGFNGLITGLGSGVADYFETLFLAEGGGLTTFATVSLVLLGVGLSIGVARWIIYKVGQ